MDINTEILISLVEARPALWDKSLDVYKDKTQKESAWKEICSVLNENFQVLEQKERQEFGKIVLKKWTQIRDSWMKSFKKHNDEKRSGSSNRRSRLYLFHDQMCFLKKITDPITARGSTDNETHEENIEGRQADENRTNRTAFQSPTNQQDTSGTRKKRKIEMTQESDADMLKCIDHRNHFSKNEENRHLSFFKSILPSLASLDEDQILEFQAGTIALIQNIKRNNPTHFDVQNQLSMSSPGQHNYCCPNSGYYSQTPQQLQIPRQPIIPQQTQQSQHNQLFFSDSTVPQPKFSPVFESVNSPSGSMLSTMSRESEEYSFADP